MKTKLLFAILLIFSSMKAQNFEWAKIFGTNVLGGGHGTNVTTDSMGNIYSTGYFNGTFDFDPNENVYNLNSSGTNSIFISKLDSDGNFVWVKTIIGGSGSSIQTDLNGNIYVTGYFSGSQDFNPNEGFFNLTSVGESENIFILKLDSSGNFIWAKSIAGESKYYGDRIRIDSNGYIYTVGVYSGTVDFDPSDDAVFNLTSDGSGLNLFVIKLDSNGGFVWVKTIVGDFEDLVFSVIVDSFDNIYTTGYYQGTVDFDPSESNFSLSSAGAFDIFIFKLDSLGNFIWAKSIGGVSTDLSTSIDLDTFGNIYCTGFFEGTVDFDPNDSVFNLTSAGQQDGFVLKINSSGNFIWAKKISGSSQVMGLSISVDSYGNIFTTGNMDGIVDFDPSDSEEFNLVGAGFRDIYISKLDSNGNFLWAGIVGNSNDNRGLSITTHSSGSIYCTGYTRGTADFNPSEIGEFNITASIFEQIFVLKLNQNEPETFPNIGMSGTLTNFADGADIVMNTEDGITYTAENISFPPNGVVKFRQDGNWTVNWGSNTFPTGTGTQGGADIPVPFSSYNVTFNYTTGAYNFEVLPPTTTLETLCGETLTGMSQKIYFEEVENAQEYTFSITNNATNVEHEIVTTNRYFTISQVPNFGFNMSYSVKGKVKVDGSYGSYGLVCVVNTPVRLGRLRDDVCNQTIEKFNGSIKSISVTGASDYRFKIVNGVDEQEIETSSRVLPLLNIENIAPNTVYQVSVAVKINDIWSPYGEVCNITTPNIPTLTLRSDYCDGTAPSLNNTFKAQSMSGVTAYRFKTIIDGNEVVVEKTSRFCRMNEFAGATIDQTYSIQVAIQYYGFWGPYGDACNWTVGTVGTRLIDEEAVANASELFDIKAYPNPFVHQITLSLSNENTKSDIMVYDMTGKLIQQVSTEQTTLEIGNNWSKGIYLVQIVQGQETKNIRIVKQ
uniref:T9SS type A sorting domain-containing protein n=3 Tax=Flavobacterium sp. TaxID=239 RepID=UPI0040490DB3